MVAGALRVNLVLSGGSTVVTRIEENADRFASLDPENKDTLFSRSRILA